MNSAETSCIPNDTRINELLYSTTWLWFISVLICPDISVLSRRKPYSSQDYSSSTIRFIFAYFSLIEVLRFSPDICGTSGIISQILISERKIFSVLYYHNYIRNTSCISGKIVRLFSVLCYYSYIWNSSYTSNKTEKSFPALHHYSYIRNILYISDWTARILSLIGGMSGIISQILFQKTLYKSVIRVIYF